MAVNCAARVALIPRLTRFSLVASRHSESATFADQQAGEQSPALADRAAASLGRLVFGQLGDIVFELALADIRWITVFQQDLPFVLWKPLRHAPNSSRRCVLAGPTVDVCPRVDRVRKHVPHCGKRRAAPFEIALARPGVCTNRKLHVLTHQPAEHAAGRSQSFELLEDHPNDGAGLFIRLKLDLSGHGNRILFLDKTEQDALQDVAGEAGAVAFSAQTIFLGSVARQDGHCQSS